MGLTEIGDTVSNHDTLEVDLSLAMFLELEIPVRYSGSEEGQVSSLTISFRQTPGKRQLTP
jgi:hypothetical protein